MSDMRNMAEAVVRRELPIDAVIVEIVDGQPVVSISCKTPEKREELEREAHKILQAYRSGLL